jgi:hypothetical protein
VKYRFGTNLWIALAVAAIAALFMPALASAAWSPVAPTPGFSGERPNGLSRLDAPDGGKFLYWHRDVGGFDTVQGMWIAADGTPGAIFDLSSPGSDYGQDLQAAVDGNGKVTVAWLADTGPNGVVRSVSVPEGDPPGVIVDISPAGDPGQTIGHLSLAITSNDTIGYVWRRFDGAIWQVEGVTVPTAGPIGTVRAYTDGPYDVRDPGIAAMANDQFRLAWIADDTSSGFSNIATIGIQNDGAPASEDPTYLYPWEKPVNGIVDGFCQQLHDPITDELLFADTGATGDPRGLEVGPGSAAPPEVGEFGIGRVRFAWVRDTVDSVDDDCTGEPVEILSDQTAVETAGFDEFGTQLPVNRVSGTEVDVSDLEMQKPRARRPTLTWLADDAGDFTKQLFRFSDGAIWNFAEGPDPVDPRVIVAENGAMGIGWTDAGPLPGQFTAGVAFVARRGNLVPVELPGLGALKSSSEPLADPGTLGRYSVLFYGIDAGDIPNFYASEFSDPGIAISPATVPFGNALLNVPNPPRSVFVTNTGSTPTDVTSVALSGPDSADFSLANPAGCLGDLVPAGSCRISVTYAPAAAGPSIAALEVETDAGDVSSPLSGTGVARTRIGLRIRPGRRAVRPGGGVRFRAVVTNRGGIASTGTRLCFSAPRRAVNPARFCRQVGNLPAGASRTINLPTRARGNAKAGNYTLAYRLRASNASPRNGRATLRILPRR